MGALAPIPSSSILSFTTPSMVTEAGLVAARILVKMVMMMLMMMMVMMMMMMLMTIFNKD